MAASSVPWNTRTSPGLLALNTHQATGGGLTVTVPLGVIGTAVELSGTHAAPPAVTCCPDGHGVFLAAAWCPELPHAASASTRPTAKRAMRRLMTSRNRRLRSEGH